MNFRTPKSCKNPGALDCVLSKGSLSPWNLHHGGARGRARDRTGEKSRNELECHMTREEVETIEEPGEESGKEEKCHMTGEEPQEV